MRDGQIRIVEAEYLRPREETGGDPAVGEGGPEAVQVFSVGVGERLEEYRAQGGEDRRRGADPQGQGGNGGEGEGGRAAEGAQRDTDVLEKGFHFGLRVRREIP